MASARWACGVKASFILWARCRLTVAAGWLVKSTLSPHVHTLNLNTYVQLL